MEVKMDPKRKQILDDVFDAFTMLAGGNYVTLYDAVAQVTRWSAGAVEMFDLPGEYVPYGAYNWGELVHPEDRKRYEDAMAELTARGLLSYDITYRVRTRDGRYGVFRNVGSVLRAEDGSPSLMGGMIANEGLLENTDPVTILRNEYGFFADLAERMREDRQGRILLVGLTGLDRVNQFYGYSHGNRVLQQIGWQLQEYVGGTGQVYRMDGAKFAIMSSEMTAAGAAALYEKLRWKLQNVLPVDNVRHSFSACGGMISFKGLRADARTLHSGLVLACAESRLRRHGALVSFDADENFELINAVRNSILKDCEGFSLRYQPVRDAATGKLVAAEALLRWKGEPWGEVLPSRFLPVLEHDAAYDELGNWILCRAMQEGKRLLEQRPDLIIGVNIAPAQLEKVYFADMLLQNLAMTGFPARNLALELSADCRMLDIQHVRELAAPLREKGVSFLVDDFGVGYGSLEFLRGISAGYVKLDPTLLKEGGESGAEALRSLVSLAAACGAAVCVKRIETAEVREQVKKFPVFSIQGNICGRPMTAEELEQVE